MYIQYVYKATAGLDLTEQIMTYVIKVCYKLSSYLNGNMVDCLQT
jgi:hypothetical protein